MNKNFKFVILIIMLCFITGCYQITTEEYIKKEIGIDISKCYIEREHDNHGGFHGDGEYIAQINCSESKNEFVNQLEKWKKIPLTENLHLIMYGGTIDGTNYMYNFAQNNDIPEIKNGYYYFIDRHSDAKNKYSDADLFDKYSYNFTLALFDLETGIFYYYELDT